MATVIASPARPGPNGGSQGDTAVFLPPRISCLASSILIPGCVQCVDCRIDTINADFTAVVVYLPPDSRPEVLSALLAFTSFSSPVFVAGDFKFDLFAPRDDEERLLSSQLNDWTPSSLCLSPPVGPRGPAPPSTVSLFLVILCGGGPAKLTGSAISLTML